VSEPEEPARTNVVDLMAALKKCLGQVAKEKKPSKRLPCGRSVHAGSSNRASGLSSAKAVHVGG
jgi:hypothetical protein